MDQAQFEYVRDILEIQRTKARYCEIADALPRQGAAAAVRFNDILTEDADADYGLGLLAGRKTVVDFLLNDIASGQAWMWHGIHSPQIDVQGETATAAWTIIARLKPKGSAQIQTLVGRYADQFRRTPEGWRIRSIRFCAELTVTQGFDPNSGEAVFGPGIAD